MKKRSTKKTRSIKRKRTPSQAAEHDDKMTALYIETYGPGKGS